MGALRGHTRRRSWAEGRRRQKSRPPRPTGAVARLHPLFAFGSDDSNVLSLELHRGHNILDARHQAHGEPICAGGTFVTLTLVKRRTIARMANLASVLKAEVVRLARKELRAETDQLRKTGISQRSDLAALRRRVAELERTLKALVKGSERAQRRAAKEAHFEDVADSGQFRFRAAGMATNRKRLGLTSADFGLLVNASGASVLAWERGRSKPGPNHLAAIAALRGVGKREVAARLESLR